MERNGNGNIIDDGSCSWIVFPGAEAPPYMSTSMERQSRVPAGRDLGRGKRICNGVLTFVYFGCVAATSCVTPSDPARGKLVSYHTSSQNSQDMLRRHG